MAQLDLFTQQLATKSAFGHLGENPDMGTAQLARALMDAYESKNPEVGYTQYLQIARSVKAQIAAAQQANENISATPGLSKIPERLGIEPEKEGFVYRVLLTAENVSTGETSSYAVDTFWEGPVSPEQAVTYAIAWTPVRLISQYNTEVSGAPVTAIHVTGDVIGIGRRK